MPNISDFKHKDAQAEVEYVKRLHEQVKAQIAKKIESYTKQANKNRKKVVLEPGDWVWNKIDIPCEYGVSSFFNIANLTPFVVGGDSEDLRANVFQEVGNDENPKAAQIQRLWAF